MTKTLYTQHNQISSPLLQFDKYFKPKIFFTNFKKKISKYSTDFPTKDFTKTKLFTKKALQFTSKPKREIFLSNNLPQTTSNTCITKINKN